MQAEQIAQGLGMGGVAQPEKRLHVQLPGTFPAHARLCAQRRIFGRRLAVLANCLAPRLG